MSNLTNVIKESFIQFSGAVLQSRALVDVRDCIKPSARQIFYCMKTDKFTSDKPFQKTLKAIGSAFRLYIHGDSSAEGVIMRAGQPFAYRYPLVEVDGSYGTLLAAESWAAPRYTGARLTPLAEYLFADMEKDTIEEWRDNYDNTEKYPAVLTSKGFYNIVNGTYGIGVGASASIPQYNLGELNNALITLLNNPDASFDEIYCTPDFCTGAWLLNPAEVKESHKTGNGAACKLRSVIEYDKKERCLVVKEIPYMVYTETICKELENIINSEDNIGIERFNDLTGSEPLIKIYLSKTANPEKVLKYLYKNTSLQSYYSVNFTLLDNGRYPKVFNWKEMLQAHIDHEKKVYRLGFEYDLKKLRAREHILDGYLICMARIEEVIQTIKKSSSTENAKMNLVKEYLLDENQATAVLKLTLSKLANLEVEKIKKEKEQIIKDIAHLEEIINSPKLLNAEIEKGLREVAAKFGDSRRTKVMELNSDDDDNSIESRLIQVTVTNKGNYYANEISSLYVQKRGGVGSKLKMENGEYVLDSTTISNKSELILFTENGKYYHVPAKQLMLETKSSLYSLITFADDDVICSVIGLDNNNKNKYIVLLTEKGFIKKSELSEYNIKKGNGNKAIVLNEGDRIVRAAFINEEKFGLLSQFGNFMIITTSDILPTGRATKGIHAIKLNDDDILISANVIPDDTKSIISITGDGYFKQTTISEFAAQGKNTKGSKIQKFAKGDWMADFVAVNGKSDLIITSTNSVIKLTTDDVPLLSRGAQGNKSIKLAQNSNIVKIGIC